MARRFDGCDEPMSAASADPRAATATFIRFGSSAPARRRLICLPFAGGTAATYRLWPQSLPADVEVRFAQLPGRDLRGAAPLDSIAAMVAAVLPAVDELADLPYAIFGHSMGALVAYELTAAIEQSRGHRPDCLFVSARRPPDEGDTHPPLAHLDDAEFVGEMRDRYNAIPDAVLAEPDLLTLLLPLLRADIRAFESYRHTLNTMIETPVHVFGGRYDARPRPELLDGWQRVARHPITVETFPGGHFFINDVREPLIRAIVSRWIGEAG